jgi:hypothetical protein
MRKISKTRSSNPERPASGTESLDTRPGRVPGATISAWSGSLAIDLDAFFAQPSAGASIAGSAPATQATPATQTNPQANGTVSLSDGTRITFATAGQFEIVKEV